MIFKRRFITFKSESDAVHVKLHMLQNNLFSRALLELN